MANKVITVTDPSIVTNDTLLGYNNYSDQDGQLGATMTPTEATNGKTITLSDGVVHEVTTKPVGTTNGEFSAVVSNEVTVDLTVPDLSLTNMVYDGITIPAEGDQVYGLNFNPDGTIMYQLSNSGNFMRQATLSTPYDMTTAGAYSQTALSGAGGTDAVIGLFFNPDGTEFYFANQTTKRTMKNTLSTPWDTTSINGDQSGTLVLANFTAGLYMNDAGTKVYTSRGTETTEVREYTLSTPWDLTSDSLTATVDTVSSLGGTTRDIFLATDGTKILIADNENLGEFTLSTPFDLSSMVLTAVNVKSFVAQDADPRAYTVTPDYSRLIMSGIDTDGDLYQYSL